MYIIDQQQLLKAYLSTRNLSVDICVPLERGDFVNLTDEQLEDFSLGLLMDNVKTGKTVSRGEITKRKMPK